MKVEQDYQDGLKVDPLACKDETAAFVDRTTAMMNFKQSETPNRQGKFAEVWEPRIPYMESL